MLVTAVGVNSQTGIIMTLLGAARTIAEEDRKAAMREGKGQRRGVIGLMFNGDSHYSTTRKAQSKSDLSLSYPPVRVLSFAPAYKMYVFKCLLVVSMLEK